jgi:hypothetical protein
MSSKLAPIESFSFSGEEFGAAGAAGLRKVRTLAEAAPTGRLFASITTLTEMSFSTAKFLEQNELRRASHVAQKLAASGEGSIPEIIKSKSRKRA